MTDKVGFVDKVTNWDRCL